MTKLLSRFTESNYVKTILESIDKSKTDQRLEPKLCRAFNTSYKRDLRPQDTFFILAELIKKKKTGLFKAIVNENDISLKSLDFAFEKYFNFSETDKQFVIHQASEIRSRSRAPSISSQGVCISQFDLIGLAQFYKCDHSFLQYLLFQIAPKHLDVSIVSVLPGASEHSYKLKYEKPYKSTLKMYEAIQKSGRNILAGKKRWFTPIEAVLEEYEAQSEELFNFFKQYTAKMISLIAAAYGHIDDSQNPIPAKENEKSIITPNTPWKVVLYFLEYIEHTIKLGANSAKDQAAEINEFHKTDVDLIFALPPAEKVEPKDQALIGQLKQKSQPWLSNRAFPQRQETFKELAIRNSSNPSFFGASAENTNSAEATPEPNSTPSP